MNCVFQELYWELDEFFYSDFCRSVGKTSCRGYLLQGPKGSGKKFLAECIAGVSSFSTSWQEVFWECSSTWRRDSSPTFRHCVCIHVFMNPMLSWRVCVFLRRFTILCYASGFYMLLFLRQMFMMHVCVCVCVCVCVHVCVCVCVCVCVWFICIVQGSWACLTRKRALEIKSLILLLLLCYEFWEMVAHFSHFSGSEMWVLIWLSHYLHLSHSVSPF